MRTVTLGVSPVHDTQKQLAAVFPSEQVGEFISFATVKLLWKVLTAERWKILQAMTGQREMTISELAYRADRDVKAVHGDVHALLLAGVLNHAESGRVIFPYDAVRVDARLRAGCLIRTDGANNAMIASPHICFTCGRTMPELVKGQLWNGW